MINLVDTHSASIPARMEVLYYRSFPPEERRDWSDIISRATSDPVFTFLTIVSDGTPAGFITTWNLGEALYVEHFAIDPALRGRGIGLAVIRKLVGQSPVPVVLEAEPDDSGELARRRIDFYTRAGFTPHHSFPYVQPPYGENLPPVRLTLITSAPLDLPRITRLIHSIVYNAR